MEEYPIYTENGKLFCKCRKSDGETITLIGKNGDISFNRFVASVTGGAATTGKKKKERPNVRRSAHV